MSHRLSLLFLTVAVAVVAIGCNTQQSPTAPVVPETFPNVDAAFGSEAKLPQRDRI